MAVLPLRDLTGGPSQQYNVSGATDAIRIALARVPNLFVIDYNSSCSYGDKDVKIRQVAQDLGVRYVIEGRFQRSGNKVRINTKLVDALTGRYTAGRTALIAKKAIFSGFRMKSVRFTSPDNHGIDPGPRPPCPVT